MITSVSSTVDPNAAANDMKKTTGMNKDDFLKLFVTQLQNQDPLNPQDSTQFISQLAQLTQVEQAYNTNTNLTSLLNQGNNGTTLAAVSLIGKQIQATGSQVSLQAGSPSTINFNLAQAANQVTVTVKDSTGATVKSINAGSMAAGDGSISWDGTDGTGKALSSGAYSFSVSAMDAGGNSVATTPLVKGKVDAVDMTGAIPMLTIGNVELSLTNVITVNGGA